MRDDTIVVERAEDSSDVTATVSVVRAVAEAESVTPDEVPPLNAAIDPEAMNDLFDRDSGAGGSGIRFSFDYCGYVVRVTDDSVTLQR